MKKIGFIGLGAMGSKIAERLLSQGYPLTVYNRTAEKEAPLVAQGASNAATPKELAADVEVVTISVTDDSAVRSLVMGESGAFAGAKPGTVFVDCSTISVSSTREFAKEAKRLGFHWLDAPVLGNPKNAEDGEMPFVVGGSEEALERAREVLESVGKKIVYMGDSGLGQAAKIVHNITCGISLVAFSEALVLGEQLGLTRAQTLEVLLNGAVSSTLLKIKVKKFEDNVFTPTAAPLMNMAKDLTLGHNAAAEYNLSLPALEVAKALYELAMARGLSREDTSSVIKALKNSK